ncbi:hypothetical protein GGR56DRAFT_300083 [Xylariaceae sp. FL0804]|nr:hypothetical protein GGR56DRAFT_300083 [Xylariaceae sp. FL0804]
MTGKVGKRVRYTGTLFLISSPRPPLLSLASLPLVAPSPAAEQRGVGKEGAAVGGRRRQRRRPPNRAVGTAYRRQPTRTARRRPEAAGRKGDLRRRKATAAPGDRPAPPALPTPPDSGGTRDLLVKGSSWHIHDTSCICLGCGGRHIRWGLHPAVSDRSANAEVS